MAAVGGKGGVDGGVMGKGCGASGVGNAAGGGPWKGEGKGWDGVGALWGKSHEAVKGAANPLCAMGQETFFVQWD